MFSNINQVLEYAKDTDTRKADHTVALKTAEFHSGGVYFPAIKSYPGADLAAGLFGRSGLPISLGLTPHALGQVVSKLAGDKSRTYLTDDRLPFHLVAEHLNWWKNNYSGQTPEWFVRLYEDKVRAVLAAGYPALNNSAILESLQSVVDAVGSEMPNTLIRPFINPDSMYLKVIWRGLGDDGHFGMGVAISTDEVGLGSLKVHPLIQRHSCTNSIVSMDGYVQTHGKRFGTRDSGQSAAFMRAVFKEELGRLFNLSVDMRERIVQAETDVIEHPLAVITSICKARNIPQSVQPAILAGLETSLDSQVTRFNLIQGFSAAAKNTESDNMAYLLETTAGGMLAEKDPLNAWIAEGRRRLSKKEQDALKAAEALLPV